MTSRAEIAARLAVVQAEADRLLGRIRAGRTVSVQAATVFRRTVAHLSRRADAVPPSRLAELDAAAASITRASRAPGADLHASEDGQVEGLRRRVEDFERTRASGEPVASCELVDLESELRLARRAQGAPGPEIGRVDDLIRRVRALVHSGPSRRPRTWRGGR